MSTQQLVKQSEEKGVSFIPFGSQEQIKLSVSVIKNLVCNQTKGGKVCDDRQAIKFMMLCQAQHLNPFAGDCFLIGYDGKNGPEFSMITSHQAFLKRAEVSPNFDGMESGVIVKNKEDGQLKELEGDFYEDEFYTLVGAWAKVHHKGHRVATVRRGALKTYRKSYGLWAEPGNHAMMLVKCVEADALRATFPTMLGGLYTPGEVTEIQAEAVDVRASRLVATVAEQVADRKPENGEQKESPPENEQVRQGVQPDSGPFDWVTGAGYNFDQFCGAIRETYASKDTSSWASFADIQPGDVRLFNRNKDGILEAFKKWGAS